MFSENPADFLMNSSICIHAVSPEGTIVYVNQFALDVLGYEKAEYVGHHVSEFYLDLDRLNDMMTRLNNLETLKNYPARVQGKDAIKYMLYNSSTYFEEEKFIHTRCYSIDIDESTFDVFVKASEYF